MKNSQDNEAVIVEDLIRRTAQLVKPSEAAGFIIEPAADSCITLRLLIHIRPDDSEPQVRDAAAIAFETLVRKYVAEDSDGVMLVPNTQKDGELKKGGHHSLSIQKQLRKGATTHYRLNKQ